MVAEVYHKKSNNFMTMKNILTRIVPILICCLFFSCISTQKYDELVQVKDYLEKENQQLKSELEGNQDLTAQKAKTSIRIK